MIRIRKFCTNIQNNCYVFSYLGDSDWVSVVKDEVGNLRYRYLYANGRPLRVGLRYINQFPPWYHRYNGRGDAAGFVEANGSGGAGWKTFGAWGDLNYASDYKGYYNWNGAWGYMSFPPKFNFDVNDVLDAGLYYAHGRWYNPDTGLWLSPNEKGDYLYSGDGQDPVNVGFDSGPVLNAPPTQEPEPLSRGKEAHRLIQTYCFLTLLPFDCRPNVPTLSGFADIVIDYPYPDRHEVYEIKPASDYGLKTGQSQLNRYLRDFTLMGRTDYVIGRTWQPFVAIPKLGGGIIGVWTIHDEYPGIIWYKDYNTRVLPQLVPAQEPQQDRIVRQIWVLSGNHRVIGVPEGYDPAQNPFPVIIWPSPLGFPFPNIGPAAIPQVWPGPIPVVP